MRNANEDAAPGQRTIGLQPAQESLQQSRLFLLLSGGRRLLLFGGGRRRCCHFLARGLGARVVTEVPFRYL